MHTPKLLLLLAASAAAATLALAEAPARADVTEPSTGHSFAETRTVDGAAFQLVGAGVRKKFIVKVYAMGLYVEQAPAKQAWAAGAKDPYAFAASGRFGKLAVMHFVRDVGADKVRDAYRDGLPEWLEGSADKKQMAEAFIALFDHDMKSGEEILLHSTGDGKLEATIAGVKKSGPQNAALAAAVWQIWLGAKPVTSDLKKALVSRIDGLK